MNDGESKHIGYGDSYFETTAGPEPWFVTGEGLLLYRSVSKSDESGLGYHPCLDVHDRRYFSHEYVQLMTDYINDLDFKDVYKNIHTRSAKLVISFMARRTNGYASSAMYSQYTQFSGQHFGSYGYGRMSEITSRNSRYEIVNTK